VFPPQAQEKNQIEIIKNSNHEVIITGDNDNYYAKKLNTFKNIKLVGFVPKIKLKDLYSKARIYVHSGSEGFGISILEAMASGCPVIVKNICGIADFLTHGIDALIYNNENELKKYIELLWNDEKLYEKLSFNGKRTAAKFSWEKFRGNWLELIRNYYILDE